MVTPPPPPSLCVYTCSAVTELDRSMAREGAAAAAAGSGLSSHMRDCSSPSWAWGQAEAHRSHGLLTAAHEMRWTPRSSDGKRASFHQTCLPPILLRVRSAYMPLFGAIPAVAGALPS